MNTRPTTPLHARHAAPQDRSAAPQVNERLCHLFRASLKYGRIHPLYVPILRYRHAQNAE